MAIEITGTVQVKDLPPNALSLTDLIPHEVGDVLSKCTLQELVDFIQVRVTARQYEVKFIRAPNPAYITDNFNMAIGSTQGIGKVGGLWEGWAICNGNNGTDNDDGHTYIGYGVNYPTVGNFLGVENVTLSRDNIPVFDLKLPISDYDNAGGSADYVMATDRDPKGTHTYAGAVNFGSTNAPIKIIQPSKVMLKIMKL